MVNMAVFVLFFRLNSLFSDITSVVSFDYNHIKVVGIFLLLLI